jgi:hypothetical protein
MQVKSDRKYYANAVSSYRAGFIAIGQRVYSNEGLNSENWASLSTQDVHHGIIAAPKIKSTPRQRNVLFI